MLIAGTQPRGRIGALVVTAAAVLVLGSASTALAGTSGGEAQSTLRPADLIADASWHGRPIKRPDQTPTRLRQPSASVEIGEGAGARASRAVRDVQRRLHALGYRPGVVDGVFGPRTRSSVAWFQIKHRLPPTGAVDGQTLNLLRFRTHAKPPAAAPAAPAAVPRAAAPRPEHAAAAPAAAPRAAPVHRQASSGLALPLLLLALVLALVVVAGFVAWLRGDLQIDGRALAGKLPRRRVQTPRAPAPRRERARPVAAVSNGNGRQVIGYAVGRDERDFLRQRRAIEQACGERGWTLTAVVKERDDGARKAGKRRPGLVHVLSQVAAGGIGQLVVGRLQSLARSPAELAVLLEWCRRRQVALLALDVGLDTSTVDGRLAARCLGAVASPPARPDPHRRPRNGDRPRTGGVL